MSQFSIKVRGITRRFEYPEECPICHRLIIEPSRPIGHIDGDKFEQVFQCSNPDCTRIFIGYYKIDDPTKISTHYKLYPIEPKIDEIPQIIHKISPKFIEIYKQASEAKQSGLDQICGPGFRKAVEFLIKDYAKSTVDDPETKKAIENTWAKPVVEKYIAEPKVQRVAEKALWLGNDETHYLRVWNDHDIEDLIALIQLTILWIDMDDKSKKYDEEIS